MTQKKHQRISRPLTESSNGGYNGNYNFIFSDDIKDWIGGGEERRKKQREDYELRVKPMREAQRAFKDKMGRV